MKRYLAAAMLLLALMVIWGLALVLAGPAGAGSPHFPGGGRGVCQAPAPVEKGPGGGLPSLGLCAGGERGFVWFGPDLGPADPWDVLNT